MQDAFEGVLNAQHGFAVVPMAVSAGVSSFGMSVGMSFGRVRTSGMGVRVFCVSVGVAGVCGH